MKEKDFEQSGELRKDYRNVLAKYIIGFFTAILVLGSMLKYVVSLDDPILQRDLSIGAIALLFIIFFGMLIAINFYTEQHEIAMHHIRNQFSHRSRINDDDLVGFQGVRLFSRARTVGRNARFFIPHWTKRNEFYLVAGMLCSSLSPIIFSYYFWQKVFAGRHLFEMNMLYSVEIIFAVWIIGKKLIAIFSPLITGRVIIPDNPIPVLSVSPKGVMPLKRNLIKDQRKNLEWFGLTVVLTLASFVSYRLECVGHEVQNFPVYIDLVYAAIPFFSLLFMVFYCNNYYFEDIFLHRKISIPRVVSVVGLLIAFIITTVVISTIKSIPGSINSFVLQLFLLFISLHFTYASYIKAKKYTALRKAGIVTLIVVSWVAGSLGFIFHAVKNDISKVTMLLERFWEIIQAAFVKFFNELVDSLYIFPNINCINLYIFVLSVSFAIFLCLILYENVTKKSRYFLAKLVLSIAFGFSVVNLSEVLAANNFEIWNAQVITSSSIIVLFLILWLFWHRQWSDTVTKIILNILICCIVFLLVLILKSYNEPTWFIACFTALILIIFTVFIIKRSNSTMSIPVPLLFVIMLLLSSHYVYFLEEIVSNFDHSIQFRRLVPLDKTPFQLFSSINIFVLGTALLIVFFKLASSFSRLSIYEDIEKTIDVDTTRIWPKTNWRIDQSKTKAMLYVKLLIVSSVFLLLLYINIVSKNNELIFQFSFLNPKFFAVLLVFIFAFLVLSYIFFQIELLYTSALSTEYIGFQLLADNIMTDETYAERLYNLFSKRRLPKKEFKKNILNYYNKERTEKKKKYGDKVLVGTIRNLIDKSYMSFLRARINSCFIVNHSASSLNPHGKENLNQDNIIYPVRIRFFNKSNPLGSFFKSIFLLPWNFELLLIYDNLSHPYKLWMNRHKQLTNTPINTGVFTPDNERTQVNVLFISASFFGLHRSISLAKKLIGIAKDKAQNKESNIRFRFYAYDGHVGLKTYGLPFIHDIFQFKLLNFFKIVTMVSELLKVGKLCISGTINRIKPDVIVASHADYFTIELLKLAKSINPRIVVVLYCPPYLERATYKGDERIESVLKVSDLIFTTNYSQYVFYQEKNKDDPKFDARYLFQIPSPNYQKFQEYFEDKDKREERVDKKIYFKNGFFDFLRNCKNEISISDHNAVSDVQKIEENIFQLGFVLGNIPSRWSVMFELIVSTYLAEEPNNGEEVNTKPIAVLLPNMESAKLFCSYIGSRDDFDDNFNNHSDKLKIFVDSRDVNYQRLFYSSYYDHLNFDMPSSRISKFVLESEKLVSMSKVLTMEIFHKKPVVHVHVVDSSMQTLASFLKFEPVEGELNIEQKLFEKNIILPFSHQYSRYFELLYEKSNGEIDYKSLLPVLNKCLDDNVIHHNNKKSKLSSLANELKSKGYWDKILADHPRIVEMLRVIHNGYISNVDEVINQPFCLNPDDLGKIDGCKVSASNIYEFLVKRV